MRVVRKVSRRVQLPHQNTTGDDVVRLRAKVENVKRRMKKEKWLRRKMGVQGRIEYEVVMRR